MPLRPAVLLLESHLLVPYINTMVHGELRFAGGPRKGEVIENPAEIWHCESEDETEWGWCCARYPKPGQDEVNYLTRLRAKLTLAQMADTVEFAMAEPSANTSVSA